jgi:hypothetical protein
MNHLASHFRSLVGALPLVRTRPKSRMSSGRHGPFSSSKRLTATARRCASAGWETLSHKTHRLAPEPHPHLFLTFVTSEPKVLLYTGGFVTSDPWLCYCRQGDLLLHTGETCYSRVTSVWRGVTELWGASFDLLLKTHGKFRFCYSRVDEMLLHVKPFAERVSPCVSLESNKSNVGPHTEVTNRTGPTTVQ